MAEKTLTPYEKLDFILSELWTPQTYFALKASVTGKYKGQIGTEQFERGVEKLREDGNAYVIDKPKYIRDLEIEDGWYIRISYKGEMLSLSGGYQQANLDSIRQRTCEIHRNVALTVGTLVAGLGALILVVWDMYKYFHSSCH